MTKAFKELNSDDLTCIYCDKMVCVWPEYQLRISGYLAHRRCAEENKYVLPWKQNNGIDKWTRKYMKLAQALADDNDACYSRSIGVILVGENNRVLSLGYNGSATGVPHADTKEYLDHLWDLLSSNEFETLSKKDIRDKAGFVEKFQGCKTCPRRILGIPSGEKLELCPCSHAERNAIYSAAANGVSTKNSTMFCGCRVPCHECSIGIIQSMVKKVVCYDNFEEPLYSPGAPWLLKKAGVLVEKIDQSLI